MAERAFVVFETCPECGSDLVVRHNRRDNDHFIGCSNFPSCKFGEHYDERTQRLAKHVAYLTDELAALRVLEADEKVLTARSELRRLMALFHPDRNPAGLSATVVTAELSALRDRMEKQS